MYKPFMYKYYLSYLLFVIIFIISILFDVNFSIMMNYFVVLYIFFFCSIIKLKKYGDEYIKNNYLELYNSYIKDFPKKVLYAELGALPVSLALLFNIFIKDKTNNEKFYDDISVINIIKDAKLWVVYAMLCFSSIPIGIIILMLFNK